MSMFAVSLFNISVNLTGVKGSVMLATQAASQLVVHLRARLLNATNLS